MKISVQTMSILNFKGIRDMAIDFNEESTAIMGANGTGKSTWMDAFTWLLFGKDSLDRKEFNLKTIDPETQRVIERIPHEVSALLSVDGDEVVLRRCYNEKWTKKRGSAIEEFAGHEVTQFVNEVPCSMKEYQQKIEEICPEHIFKLITNPLYFPSQKKEVQRQTLFTMAGDVSDEDIAQLNEDFSDLIKQITGKTLDGYKKEIAAKKRLIKDEITQIPGRIDERKRSIPESEDWTTLETELESKRKMIADIDNQVVDRSKLYEEAGKRKQEIVEKLNSAKTERLNLEFKIKETVLESYRTAQSERNRLVNQLSAVEANARTYTAELATLEAELQRLNSKRDELLKEWKRINAETLQISDNELVCPTCKRQLEYSDIEAKQAEMTANFNTRKAIRLEDNKRVGISTKKKIETQINLIADKKAQIKLANGEIAKIENCELYKNEPKQPDATPTILANKEYISFTNKITDFENQLSEEVEVPDLTELQSGKEVLNSSIEELNARLAKRDLITANKKRITELETEHRKLSQELADLEGIEFTMAAFSKAKIEQVEGKINGLFEFVRFKMYEQQINGGEIETCEAMVNGVPFSDLNTAMQINAGLDIINAICRHNDVYAPIFIDNAESVNELHKTNSQMIRLVVTTDSKLKIA